MIKPIGDGIFFIFLDKVDGRGNFYEQTDWGFEHSHSKNRSGYNHQVSVGRWGKIVALGDSVNREKIPLSSFICIEPLMWTNSFEFTDSHGDSFNIWKTDPSKIMLISSENPFK